MISAARSTITLTMSPMSGPPLAALEALAAAEALLALGTSSSMTSENCDDACAAQERAGEHGEELRRDGELASSTADDARTMASGASNNPPSAIRAAFGSPLHEVGEVAAFVVVVVLALIVAAVLQHEKS